MVTTPTVLVLGAGASLKYGYPTARELVFYARSAVRNRVSDLAGKLSVLGDVEEADIFMEKMVASNLPSIDYFLWRRPQYASIGKRVIAGALLEHEAKAGLTRKPGMEWYEHLWHRIEALPDDFISGNKLSVVTFNYDRSLEAFLFASFLNSHGLAEAEAAACMGAIDIVHVYGKLLDLPYESEDGSAYGSVGDHMTLARSAEQLQLIGDEPSEAAARARTLIGEAHRICFLGFSYGEENLRRLGFGDSGQTVPPSKAVYGSAMGIGLDARQALSKRIRRIRLAGPEDGCLNTLLQFSVLR